ncbi:HpcH/HpaI aldolase family protein [Jannaschia formosa]|uniref:HpcH/HpaI aldolase family protein n=1 Tax=Jannaschia formosa TaxID=2259592 RepID=UPI00142F757C|nr:aldolase/citrate lyase family protein [Jannaschia formosa]
MTFVDLLSRPRPPLGSWLMSGSPDIAEAMATRDFDFLVIDMEHVPVAPATVVHMARAIEARGKVPVVRTADHDPATIRWMLDMGLGALMVPMVDTPAEAAALVSIMDYPPNGRRGFAAMLRANAYNSDPSYFAEARSRITFIAQLETPAALDALEEVAAVPGVDALFVGPGDISATTGHLGDATGAPTLDLIRDAAGRASRAGIPIGTVMPRPDLVRDMLAAGCGFAAVGSDLGLLTAAAETAIKNVRGS